MTGKVLLVDDDPALLRLIELELEREDIVTVAATTGAEALRRVEAEEPVAVVLDLGLPDMNGKEVLSRLRREHPAVPVVVFTAEHAVDEVVECMRLGAVDFVQKPLKRERLLASVKNARTQGELGERVRQLAQELRAGSGLAAILGASPAIEKAKELLGRAAKADVTALIEGPSGTGKEIAARAIHAESARRDAPFVAVNCGAIPAELIESELFGHEKGAFTGASARRRGRFEQAEGGTAFLDEVGELRLDLQVKLLRVLQDRRIQRVGADGDRPIDVRVIAATNRDLKVEIAAGRFREDLYYRLAVFPIRLPALRDRGGDVRILAEAFLERFAKRHGRRVEGFTPKAMQAIEAHTWPGNVRELENAVERATILEDGPRLSFGSLPEEVICAIEPAGHPSGEPSGGAGPAAPAAPATAGEIPTLESEERRLIQRALAATGWNVREAAQKLGVGRATIYRKIEAYGLAAPQGRVSV